VYVTHSGTFTKSGSAIIYGDTNHVPYPVDGNPTDNTAPLGNAVYVDSSHVKRRETTAEANVDLAYDYNAGSPIISGAWEY
jgi:hypothetical protein